MSPLLRIRTAICVVISIGLIHQIPTFAHSDSSHHRPKHKHSHSAPRVDSTDTLKHLSEQQAKSEGEGLLSSILRSWIFWIILLALFGKRIRRILSNAFGANTKRLHSRMPGDTGKFLIEHNKPSDMVYETIASADSIDRLLLESLDFNSIELPAEDFDFLKLLTASLTIYENSENEARLIYHRRSEEISLSARELHDILFHASFGTGSIRELIKCWCAVSARAELILWVNDQLHLNTDWFTTFPTLPTFSDSTGSHSIRWEANAQSKRLLPLVSPNELMTMLRGCTEDWWKRVMFDTKFNSELLFSKGQVNNKADIIWAEQEYDRRVEEIDCVLNSQGVKPKDEWFEVSLFEADEPQDVTSSHISFDSGTSQSIDTRNEHSTSTSEPRNSNLITTRWGIFTYQPILNMHFNFGEIERTINHDNLALSKGLYNLLPRIFPSSVPSAHRRAILTTKWGSIRVNPTVTFYIDLVVVQDAINSDQSYAFGKGLYELIPRILRREFGE
jgi:hypothetical protein